MEAPRIFVIAEQNKDIQIITKIIKNTSINNIKTCLTNDFSSFQYHLDEMPDLIIIDLKIINDPLRQILSVLESISYQHKLPVIIISNLKNLKKQPQILTTGWFSFCLKPLQPEILLANIEVQLKIKFSINELASKIKMIETAKENLENEKSILETSLDILSHDTKNLFDNIINLLHQCPKHPLLKLIKEDVNELFEMTMESVSYTKTKKRVVCLSDLVQKIRITHLRTLLTQHERINIKHSSRFLLYAEISDMFKNAIANIIENALKYSPAKSQVEVRIEYHHENIIIQIIDNGTGIPDCEKEDIFKKYYRRQENESIEGSGKGLWIAKNIVTKEGGSLFVEDNQNGGSIFTITLPVFKLKNRQKSLKNLSHWFKLPMNTIKLKLSNIHTLIQLNVNEPIDDLDSIVYANLLDHLRKEKKERDSILIQKKLNQLKHKNPSGKRVLIIDDSLHVHYYLAAYFTKLGYNIADYATNGKEGIFLYKKYKPDLIALDYTMPIMSGLETAEKIFQINPNAQIIFITALGELNQINERLQNKLPINKYRILCKPINLNSLQNILNNF